MSFVDRLRRITPATWAAVFAVLLVFPWLGSFGFWDPWELGIAERAREMARSGHLTDVTAGGRYGKEPPLDLILAALGMKVFGLGELGARIGNGVFAVLALLAVYWAGAGLFRKRAALLATLALGTMPLFFLQARQLTSDMPLVAGLALALGGLGRFAWPGDGRRRWRDLAVGLLGMLIGTLSGGAMLGAALPALALLATVAVAWTLTPGAAAARGAPAGGAGCGPRSAGRSQLRPQPARQQDRHPGAGDRRAGRRDPDLHADHRQRGGAVFAGPGGDARGGTPPNKFEYLIRQVGFGAFPWSALMVFALGRALVRLGDERGERAGRLAFGQLYLLVFAAFGFALSTVFVLMTGDARFAALAPLALALGAFLDEAMEGERAEPVLGLLAGTGTMVVARDLFLAPEEIPSLHVLTKVKWPPQLRVAPGFLAVGVVVALGIYLGLATRGRALGKVALRDIGTAGPLRQRLERWVVHLGRWGIEAAVAAAVVFAALVAFGLQPVLSRHFSFKPVLESFSRYAKGDEALARYRVEGHGTGFYSSREMEDLPSQDKVIEFLRRPKRVFALVAADELAALDAGLKGAKVSYFVVDASSSRFLLLSNRLETGEQDQNPLVKNVWMAPQPPTPVPSAEGTGGVRFDWHAQQPPWPAPRVPAFAEFANSIELVGADYPPSLRRPGKIPLVLHFRVNQKPPAGYKIFVHFDASGSPRLLGDHAPLDGAFPTSHWLPGEYIKDLVEVDVPLMTTPAGRYTLYLGFWPGGEQRRLKITGGNINDGVDRARVGTIDIR